MIPKGYYKNGRNRIAVSFPVRTFEVIATLATDNHQSFSETVVDLCNQSLRAKRMTQELMETADD